MKTVRPFGVVVLGLLLVSAWSGCTASDFGINQTTRVVFVENGVPVTLTDKEYAASRGLLKDLLAKRRFDLEPSLPKARLLTTVEIRAEGLAPNRKVTAMKVASVEFNPTRTKTPWPVEASGSWLVEPSGYGPHDSHPSLALAHTLDRTLSSGEMASGR